MQAHAGNSLGFAVDSTLPASLTAQVAQGLREAIRKGVLKVGEPLPSREALAQRLGVSECVVRAALRDLAADRLVVGKPRRGHVVLAVPQERRARLVLDIETANLGSFCSHISVMACAHAIQRQGHRVLSVVLGTDARETPYLRPLQEALQQRPDMAVVRVASSRRALVTRLLASCGCPYATVTLGKLTRSPGRFAGNLCHNVDDAISDLVAACVRMGVRSALQVDFGVDTYIRADLAFEQAGVFVERLSVPLVGNRSLDDIAQAACAATERRPGADRVRPEPGRTRDRALRVGVAAHGNAGPLRQSASVRRRTKLLGVTSLSPVRTSGAAGTRVFRACATARRFWYTTPLKGANHG